jgi:hypothetical protein
VDLIEGDENVLTMSGKMEDLQLPVFPKKNQDMHTNWYPNSDVGKVHCILILTPMAFEHSCENISFPVFQSHTISILLWKHIISRCPADTFLASEVHSQLIWHSVLQFLKIKNEFTSS